MPKLILVLVLLFLALVIPWLFTWRVRKLAARVRERDNRICDLESFILAFTDQNYVFSVLAKEAAKLDVLAQACIAVQQRAQVCDPSHVSGDSAKRSAETNSEIFARERDGFWEWVRVADIGMKIAEKPSVRLESYKDYFQYQRKEASNA